MMLPFSTGHGPKTFTASLLQTNVPVTKFYVCLTGHLLVWDSLHGCHNNRASKACNILCSASRERRGFGPQPKKKDKLHNVKPPREGASNATQNSRKLNSRQTDMLIGQSPGLANSGLNGKSGNAVSDRQFEEKLEAVKRSAMEQRKAEETKAYQAIDYDAPIESNQSTIGLGAKVGVGLAVLVFGLVFALGDFLPSGSENPNEEGAKVEMRLTEEEKAPLQARLQQYEAKLRISPKDLDAIEGAAVTLSELGEYKRAASLLEKLTQERPSDSEAFRLLGEIKYELKDYEGSASAYRSSASVSQTINLEVLRGLTNSLLAAQKPDEAVQVLLATHESLNSRSLKGQSIQADGRGDSGMPIDPIQVELLLGKAYSDWGHVSDAVSVYDRLISMYPNDFRGYLAKGILLKENDKVGDAERMFIQARFFAPEKAKALVDRYSRQ